MSFTNIDPENIPALSDREKIGKLLQQTLSELIALHLVGKHIHWNIVGEHFISYHRLIDEFIENWYESADTVAERAVQLGYSVDGQAATAAKGDEVLSVGVIEDEDAIEILVARVLKLSGDLRGRLAGLDDLVTQNILIGIIQDLEKQLWFLRAHLIDSDDDDDEENEPEETPEEPGETSEETSAKRAVLEPPKPTRTLETLSGGFWRLP